MSVAPSRRLLRRTTALAVSALLVLAGGAAAESRFAEIETKDLRLVYPARPLSFIAPYAARCFENSMTMHRRLFGYTPGERVTVMLVDNSDFGNAAVVGNPRNTMSVQIAPWNFVYETAPSNERINFVMNHELAHVVTLDQAATGDRFWRRLFLGKVRESSEHPETILYSYLAMPRRAAPRWHREGTAVFFETWMSGGLGRAQGPWDEMVYRAMVRDSTPFYDPLGLESEGARVDFQVGVNSYLYGERFMTWMADRWGPRAFLDWVSRGPGSRGYFASQFQKVTGEHLGDAWREWVADERRFQRANLDSVRSHRVTGYRDLSARALGSVSHACLDTAGRCLYAGVFYPGKVAHVAAIPLDGGAIRDLGEVKGPAIHFVCSLAWDPDRRRLFYTTDNGDWRDLCEMDPATGRTRRLMKEARIGDLAFNRQDRSLWGVRHFNGISTIVRLTPPYTDYSRVASFPYGRDVYDLDISPDGRRLALSMASIGGHQALRLYDLATLQRGDTTGRTLFDFGSSIPNGFVFSPDGDALYGSSCFTGVSNLFRWDLAADSMDIVTNAETGFFRPVPVRGDSLIAFRYSGAGFVPAKIDAHPLAEVSTITFFGQQVIARHPELESWRIPPPSAVPIDSLITRRGPYRPLASLRLVSLYPVVESYREHTSAGLQARFLDPASFHDFTLTGSVTGTAGAPAGQRVHLALTYRGPRWSGSLKHDPASFYDLFGPTKTSRKGDGASLGWKRTLIQDEPRHLDLAWNVEGWKGLDRLPEAQNVAVAPGFDEVLGGMVELTDQFLRSSIGAVDPEKGWKWRLTAGLPGVRYVRGDRARWRGFPAVEAAADVGAPMPLRNSSLWLRTAAGVAAGPRDEPFANFFFGGFGNNYVDWQEPKRYRFSSSFPGEPLDAVAGTRYARAMLDASLPPVHFARVGIPGFYATWLRPAVFGSALSANFDDATVRRTVGDLGVQLDLRLILLSQQPFTLSGGYARAFEKHQDSREEWMLSLKVL